MSAARQLIDDIDAVLARLEIAGIASPKSVALQLSIESFKKLRAQLEATFEAGSCIHSWDCSCI